MTRKIVRAAALLLALALAAGCASDGAPGEKEEPMNPSVYFSFDESGAQVCDAVSQKQYAVNYVFADAKYKQSEPPKRTAGVSGSALSFDGYSTFIEAECPVEDTRALTVSLWVAPRAFATRTDGCLTGLVSAMGAAGGFSLGIYNYGAWCFEAVTDQGTCKLWSTESALTLCRWNYLTAVFDGEAGQMRLYRNGQQVASCAVSASVLRSSDVSMLIGKSRAGAVTENVFEAGMFGGLLDELEIYASALTDAQIQEKYRAHASVQPDASELWLDSALLADDRYAPQYHLRVAQNWQNETYGFFYYGGYYHAFCQQNPLGPYYTDGQRWGHFVSTDLVHWEELPSALVPEENGIDNNHVFSGCAALLPSGEPKLFYTGVNYASGYLNLIATADPADLSDPKLTEWVKTEKVVVEQGDLSTANNFRDPFIYEENGAYFMLVGGTNRQTGGGAIYCFRAADDTLESWEYLSMLYSGDSQKYAFLGNCYELPNLFRLTNRAGTVSKYLLMFSPIGNVNGVYYLLGDFDAATGAFIPEQEEPCRYDVGPKSQVLCPSGFYDPATGRNLLITMARTGMDAQERYDSGWATVMTLIKELSLSDAGELVIEPIGEYASLNKACLLQAENLGVDEANALLAGVKGDMLRIEATIDPMGSEQVGAYVKYDDSGAERVKILYDTARSCLEIDASKSSTDMRNNGAGGGTVAITGDVELTIFVDRAMVEAYLNGTNQATAFGYNASPDADGVRLFASGGDAVIKRLAVYELQSSTGNDAPAFWG